MPKVTADSEEVIFDGEVPGQPARIYELIMSALSEQGRAVVQFLVDGKDALQAGEFPESFEEIEAFSLSHDELTLRLIRESMKQLGEVEEQRSRDVAKFQSRARSVEAHEVAERELAQSKSKLKEELEIERNTIAKLRSEAQRERRETAILRARLESVEQEETKLVKELQHKEEEVTKLRNSIKRKAEETARVKQKGAEDETAVLDAQNTLLRLEEKLARSEEKRVALGAALSAAERKIAEQVKVWAASGSGDGSSIGTGDGDEMLRQKLAKSEQERMKLAGVLLKLMKKQEALKRESTKKRVGVLNTGNSSNINRIISKKNSN